MTALEMLRQLEWCGQGHHFERICYICEGVCPEDARKAGKAPEKCGHKPDCELATILDTPSPRQLRDSANRPWEEK